MLSPTPSTSNTSSLASAARKIAALNRYLAEDLLGGPRMLKLSWVINAQKGATALFVLVLILWFRNFSAAAWVYWGLHGGYGLCWLVKHCAFPDPGWEKRVTFGGAIVAWLLVLGPYWIAPVLLVTPLLGSARPTPSNATLGIAILVHSVGVVVMMAADAQKYFTLEVRRGLIQDGMFKYVRHPNYLGEMLVYGSYAFIVGHWLPWAVLAFVWIELFATNMLVKEASMSRYPEWPAYKARTGMLLPRVVGFHCTAKARDVPGKAA
jgi:protein-S-isoprenylcysteine O-methyltransferase Ste14